MSLSAPSAFKHADHFYSSPPPLLLLAFALDALEALAAFLARGRDRRRSGCGRRRLIHDGRGRDDDPPYDEGAAVGRDRELGSVRLGRGERVSGPEDTSGRELAGLQPLAGGV